MGFMTKMSKEAEGLLTFGVIALIGIAIVIGFKDSGKVDNDEADNIKDNFSTMITFLAIGVIGVIGFALLKLARKQD